jgi:hypothetical protein
MRLTLASALLSCLSAAANSQIVVAGPDYKPPAKIEPTVCAATLGDHRTAYSTHIWVSNDTATNSRIAKEFEAYAKSISRYARSAGCNYYASYNSIPTDNPMIVATGWTGGYPTEPPPNLSVRSPRSNSGEQGRTSAPRSKPEAQDTSQRVRRDNPLGKTPNQVKYELAMAVHQAQLAANAKAKADLEAQKRRQREAAQQVLSQHDQAMAQHRQVVAASDREQAEYRAKLATPAPKAPEEKVEFKEGVVACEKRAAPSREWRCQGPLQVTYAVLDTDKARVPLGQACGSERSIRDLGMISGYRIFGCGFGIHPTARDYPGNTDVPAKLGLGYVPGRASFYCPRSKLAYCR